MHKHSTVKLFPNLTDCHICLEILLDCVNDCLTPFLFNIKNVVTAYPELTLAKMKDKILFGNFEMLYGSQ